ncbi:MAG: DUF1993 family protein [Pseudolabrys sp.]
MPISVYDASIPVFQRMLTGLSRILLKAEAHAEALKIDPAALLQARLYPDMFPLVRQVQVTSDIAKGAAGRLGGIEFPRYADDEQSFANLRERIGKTLNFIDSVPSSAIAGSESRTIVLNIAGSNEELDAKVYLLNFALPNFFFHVTTAYDILRHLGVPIGKRDYYLGGQEFRDGIRKL